MAAEIRASTNKPFAILMKEAKNAIKEKTRIELHGLGESVTNVVRAAEMLTSLGYAELVTFHTTTVESEREGVNRSKAKVIITLNKASGFDRVFDEFEKRVSKRVE